MKRAQQLLDGQWLFRIDRDEQGEALGWHAPGLRPTGWLKVPVPGNWDTYLPELFGYAGHAWHQRRFKVKGGWQGSRVHLRFEGANYETTVWLNGREAGRHAGGFDPFEFDVTDLLDWEGQNTLAVRVDNWPRIGRVPNSYGGWWNYGGIYRSVRLLALPPLRIADTFVRAEPPAAGDEAPLNVEVTVINEGSEPAVVSPLATVALGDDRAPIAGELAAPAQRVAPGETAHFSLRARLPAARLWSPAQPNLYTLRLALKEGRHTRDSLDVSFGVRRFEVRGTQVLLNGEPIVLAGVNRHEEYAGKGRVDPGSRLEADLRLVKEMGGNMVRMHYQGHSDLYDLADRLGLLLFAEIPAWQVGVRDPQELADPRVRQTAEAMLRTLIRSLKNHPSVVIWSVGNECATKQDEARPLFAHLAQVARSLDSTRPVAYVGMYGPDEKVFDLVDLPCINVYKGLRTQELADLVDRVHALQPGKPLLIAEFGHEAVLGLRGEGYGTEDEQAQVLEAKWQVFRERRAFIPGGLIWCLADYWHMPAGPEFGWMNRIYFCHGLTTLARQRKRAVAAVKRMWVHP